MKIILILFAFIAGPWILAATPSQRYLERHSLEKIVAHIEPYVQAHVPLLLKIASLENETTFFGYHAISYKSRLFQDILKAVFEEILQITLPENFFFMRLPGDSQWHRDKKSFLDYFANRPVSQKQKELVMRNLFACFQQEQNLTLTLEDFSKKEISQLWSHFAAYIAHARHEEWIRKARKYALPVNYAWPKLKHVSQLEKILGTISKKIAKKYKHIDCDPIMAWFREKLDFGNYQMASFHYVRHLEVDWATQDKCYKYFERFIAPFDDTSAPQQAMLVSLNIPIFGNYNTEGCFSAKIFIDNVSVVGGDARLLETLEEFFIEIGLDASLASQLWLAAEHYLKETEHQGCLMQFFDDSANLGQKPFAFIEKAAYLAFKHGVPIVDVDLSKYILGDYMLTSEGKDVEIRLLMQNQTTLNPFSPLRMMRHDFLPEHISKKMLDHIKYLLKHSHCHESRRQKYIKKLEQLWQVSLKTIN